MARISSILQVKPPKHQPVAMKAYIKTRYGGPEVLELKEYPRPNCNADEILVRVKANSANPADWHILRGKPFIARFAFGLFRPKYPVLGSDFAGVVEEVGGEVNDFKKGDRVFGEQVEGGAFAEYTAIKPGYCALMLDGTDFSQMAALPIAGLTALQALTTHGKLERGESVLINGASGGVGHLAVQIAKVSGARVTGVCSSGSAAFVESLGVDQVIPYDREDIHRHTGRYNLVIDTHGNLNYQDFVRMGDRGVTLGFTTMGHMIGLLFRKALGNFPLVQFTASANAKDLAILAIMVTEGQLKPLIDRSYSYSEIPEAIAYIEKMRTRGKVVMTWE